VGDVLAVLATALLLAGVVFGMYLRDCAPEESPLETRFRDPKTRTIAYVIPDGADPVVLRLGLDRAGFTGEVRRVGNAECLLVTCLTTERAALRGVLEAAQSSASAGTALKLGGVVFEDER